MDINIKKLLFSVRYNPMTVCMFTLILCFIFFVKSSKKMIECLNTFNGRMAVDDQYFYDKLFDDVVYYPNEYNRNYKTSEDIGKLTATGWMRCNKECNGRCQEFGITGHAYCFPY